MNSRYLCLFETLGALWVNDPMRMAPESGLLLLQDLIGRAHKLMGVSVCSGCYTRNTIDQWWQARCSGLFGCSGLFVIIESSQRFAITAMESMA